MSNTLLPHNLSAKHLQNLIKLIAEKFKPKKIICFGKIITDHHQSGCFFTTETGCKCHYFLLVAGSTPLRIDHEVQEFSNAHFKCGKITVLAHSEELIQSCIRQGDPFYNKVYGEGRMLYSWNGIMETGCSLQPDPGNVHKSALKHYQHRYGMALGFWDAARVNLEKKFHNNAVFLMHQVIEQCCIGLVWVHIAYRSDMHSLGRLLDLCLCFSDKPASVFPRQTGEDQRLFSLLQRSYSEARYKDGFSVSNQDAHILMNQVNEFVELTKQLCTDHLAALQKEVEETNKQEED